MQVISIGHTNGGLDEPLPVIFAYSSPELKTFYFAPLV